MVAAAGPTPALRHCTASQDSPHRPRPSHPRPACNPRSVPATKPNPEGLCKASAPLEAAQGKFEACERIGGIGPIRDLALGVLVGCAVGASPLVAADAALARIPTDALGTIKSVPKVPDAEELMGARLPGRARAPATVVRDVRTEVKDVLELNRMAKDATQHGNYEQALESYTKVIDDYSDLALSEYARVRRALMLYQLGRVSDAILALDDEEVSLRGYAEVHAALASVLYAERPSQIGRAEEQWDLAMSFDQRYKEPAWVAENKDWPPKMLMALEKFLELR
eukprot:evm.model.scf_53EXC.10 EVM.evm.TU.scf_53EXC.10   scf_53EXC:150904-153050(+)